MNIIVAGGTRGVGLELVNKLGEISSNHVIGLGRTIDPIKNKSTTENIEFLSCDLSSKSTVNKVFSDIFDRVGSVNVLINCAATWTGGISVKEMTEEFLKESIDLNFFTTFNPISFVLNKSVYEIDAPLKIINLGATASLRGGANCFAFSIGKSSVRMLSQSISREMGRSGVHCCHMIIDGLIDNPRTRELNPGLVDENYIQMSSIVSSVEYILAQPRDCWTNEFDIRPYCEKF